MALYRSPSTVTLWPSSFLKKYGPMIPPAHKAHQTVSFSGCNGVSTYTCGLASLQMRQFCLYNVFVQHNLVALHFKWDFWHTTATAGSDVVQSSRQFSMTFFQHLWPYIGNNTANVVFQMVKRLWLIRIDQRLYIAPQKIV
ncbi:hypothetical protein TNCV_1915971 [Trichonephila clavipes]|uniref:Uncharacterized protein n=1 Tax=Trichonephila clavipes TaxID=2585209 RepID=A0A8X7BCV8_TRICX|nr:hypothetical protein TNCV_1915971 [Trichonephila clavipes]